MAYTNEERIAAIAAHWWSYPEVGMRANLVSLGIADGKTLEQAIAYADAYGGSFSQKTPLERMRVAGLVNTGATGILDALLTGTPKLHTLLGEGMSVRQFNICLYLLKNGDTLSTAILGARGVTDTDLNTEAVLYFLLCGKTLQEAKAAAGVG